MTEESPLWSKASSLRVDYPAVGRILKEYRRSNGLTQRELAARVRIDQSYISRIERGRPVRDVGLLMQLARLLDLPPSAFGLSNELLNSVQHRAQYGVATVTSHDATADEDPIVASQDAWRSVRRYLNQHRHELAQVATTLYPAEWRIGETTLLAPREWLPADPVRLEDLQLRWRPEDRRSPVVSGSEAETNAVRPLRAPGMQYDSYTSAVRYLDAPTLFENRPSYQLLDLGWSADRGALTFGIATYFDKLDVAEAVGHELAHVQHDLAEAPTWRDLPFRSLIGNPFDTRRRAILPAITTLTLRKRRTHGTAGFMLHWRDPTRVATAAGIYDVIPAGEFQPSSIARWDQKNDFDIWRNIVREFSEELLGTPEHDGSRSTPIDYDGWPLYRLLQRARAEGRLSVYCLGAAIDALTLAPTIMTVVVIDDDIFDEAFRNAVAQNSEGIVITSDKSSDGVGIPFTEPNVRRFVEREPMASPGAGCLHLAWKHRIELLIG